MFRTWHNEVHELYGSSVRKAVFEYALESDLILSRLMLKPLEPLMKSSKLERARWKDPLYRDIPHGWRLRFNKHKQMMAKELRRCDASVVSLRHVWMNLFECKLGLKLGAELECLFPLQLKDFKQMQVSRLKLLPNLVENCALMGF